MSNTQKPDPSDVDPIDTSRYIYERDENGDLIPEADVVEVDGEWQRIEHLPPAKGFLSRLESKFEGRDEISIDEMDDLMADWYVDPDPDNWADADPKLYVPLMNHLVSKLAANMGDDDIVQELQDEIEERQSEGN